MPEAESFPGAATMQPHPIVLQKGLKKLRGHMFVAPSALYFICSKSGSVVWDAVGDGVGGLVGGIIQAVGEGKDGEAPESTITEEVLRKAVAEAEGSLVFEPNRINVIKQTLWTRLIRYDGQVYGARSGFSKELRKELGPWVATHGVKSKGMG